MTLRQKKLLKFFITHNNQDLKKSCAVWWRLFYCLAEERSAYRRHGLRCGGSVYLANLEGSCLNSGGSWRPGVLSLCVDCVHVLLLQKSVYIELI